VRINLKGEKARITIKKTEFGHFYLDVQGYVTDSDSVLYDKVSLCTGIQEPVKVEIETDGA
jgi:hypothetical protein